MLKKVQIFNFRKNQFRIFKKSPSPPSPTTQLFISTVFLPCWSSSIHSHLFALTQIAHVAGSNHMSAGKRKKEASSSPGQMFSFLLSVYLFYVQYPSSNRLCVEPSERKWKPFQLTHDPCHPHGDREREKRASKCLLPLLLWGVKLFIQQLSFLNFSDFFSSIPEKHENTTTTTSSWAPSAAVQ